MENLFAKTEELANDVKELVNVKLDSAKLSIAEKSSKVASNIIAALIVASVIIFFLVLFSVAFAFFLSQFTGSTWSGFLIVSGIYLLIALIVLAFKERLIRNPIMTSILSQMTKDEEPDEED